MNPRNGCFLGAVLVMAVLQTNCLVVIAPAVETEMCCLDLWDMESGMVDLDICPCLGLAY
jgi:hypothetical protein